MSFRKWTKIFVSLTLVMLMFCCAAGSALALATEKTAMISEYWTEGSAAAESLNTYLAAVTDVNSPDYIPEECRIAVFDLDGTLMCETFPFCFEYMVFADYALNSKSDTITDEVRAVAQEIVDASGKEKPSGMSTRQAAAGAIAYKGMTMSELADVVTRFKDSDAWGFKGMTRGEAFYKPMVELFYTLLKHDFSVYIVTATERNIVRTIIDGTLDIPASHVIGTEYGYTATGQGDAADSDYTFQGTDKIVFDGNYYGENAKTSKVDAIVREIGQQPVLAFGNSSGDLAMEIYTISDNPYKSAAYMVLADDEVREYGNAEDAGEKKASYEEMGIGTISMRDDFETIYGEEVVKNAPNEFGEFNANVTFDDLLDSEEMLVAGPKASRYYIEEYVSEHPEIIWEFSKYLEVYDLVQHFAERYPEAENYNTYEALTGAVKNQDSGFCVTFHQNLAEDDPFGGYTPEEYAAMCAITVRELGTDTVNIGYYGNPEVSFTCMDKEKALRFAIQHNQNSVYCVTTDETIYNPEWIRELNSTVGIE